MADTAFSMARDYLLPFLKEAFSMIRLLPKDVEDMEEKLEQIQGWIHKLDAMDAAEEVGTKRRMKELVEISFSMEDLIDECMISMEHGTRNDSAGCAAFCESAVDFIKTMVPRYQLARKVKDINSRFRGINESSDFQNLTSEKHVVPSSSAGSGNMQKLRSEDPLYLEESEMVGFEEPKKELIGWLLEERKERTAISVVGMGGQGKTTLARKVFDNQEIIAHFGCRVWITVSESCNAEALLGKMLKQIRKEERIDSSQDVPKMDRGSLIEEVRMHLCQERYVVLFDDVWHVDFWDAIENAVIDNKKGSRIVTTTRHMEVANSFKTSSFVKIHELKPLSFEQSWTLFCQKTFKFGCGGTCPKELEDTCSKIVKKCGGLPLAVVVIGGLLSCKYKTKVDEWEMFGEMLSSKLKNDKKIARITNILSLSYDALPSHLKSCLLYFGIYPEDYEIKCKTLIRQWVAEGFVRDEPGELAEEVAEHYLEELINRSLVQVASLSIDGKVKRCRIHDLTREMILKKFKDLSFCHNACGTLEWNGISRRLTVTSEWSDFNDSIESSHIRSIFAFRVRRISQEFLSSITNKYMSLKILAFEPHNPLRYYGDIITNMGNLIQLKYLSLRDIHVTELPNSIVELQNLETLDIRGTWLNVLPMGISKLRKLRHLMGDKFELKEDIGGLKSLQTLNTLIVDENGERIRELGELTRLRKLGLDLERIAEGTLSYPLNKLQQLESLSIRSMRDVQIESPPLMLRKFYLYSTFSELPEWIPELHKLVKLTLVIHGLTNDPMNSLKDLPNLLFLCHARYHGESLHFEEGGFPKLKQLELLYMHMLNSLSFDQKALPSLTLLCLDRIPKLQEVPSGIQHLEKLEVLKVEDMSKKFEENLAPVEGPAHPAIQHVPLVEIRNPRTNRVIHHQRR